MRERLRFAAGGSCPEKPHDAPDQPTPLVHQHILRAIAPLSDTGIPVALETSGKWTRFDSPEAVLNERSPQEFLGCAIIRAISRTPESCGRRPDSAESATHVLNQKRHLCLDCTVPPFILHPAYFNLPVAGCRFASRMCGTCFASGRISREFASFLGAIQPPDGYNRFP